MNKKQAMRLAKKLAEQEAAKAAEEEKKKKQEEMERKYPIYTFTLEMNELEWADDERPGNYMVAHWPAVKEELKEQMVDGQRLDFKNIKMRMPEGCESQLHSLQMDFGNLMNECDMFFLNAQRYEEMIPVFTELLEIRDLSKDELTKNNYIGAIGEAYDMLGQKEARDRVFAEHLSKGRNDYLAAKYASLLLDNEELEKAEKLLADYTDSKDEFMMYQLEQLSAMKKDKGLI